YYPVVCAQEFTTFDVLLDQLLYRKRGLSGDMLNGTGNILPSEFEDVVGVGKDAFEKQLCIEDADSLEPLYFEALIAVIFPLKTRPLAGKFPCAVMGSTGGSHDTETAHGGTDHRSPEGCPSGHRGPRALPQARHFGCHFLQVAGEVCGTRSQRCEEAALPRRRKPAVETDGGGASPGHPGAESGHHKKLV